MEGSRGGGLGQPNYGFQVAPRCAVACPAGVQCDSVKPLC